MFNINDIESYEYIDEPIVYDIQVENNHNYFINAGSNILVHNSGKTYGILQYIAYLTYSHPPPKIDPIITVLGSTVPNLKKGAYRHFKSIIYGSEILTETVDKWNESDRTVKFKSGWVVEFVSAINEQEAKQGKRQYLFANEANGIDKMIFWQMAKRTRIRSFVDYNPTSKFWIHNDYINADTNDLSASVGLYITDHRHNPFLSLKDHERTENIPDPELHKVYARGLTGQFKGLIYPKWFSCDYIPSFIKTTLGLDFGYNHKMALVECGKWENRIYSKELIYRTEMTTGELISEMKELGISNTIPIYADSARPDAIKELRAAGFNCMMADKAVIDGINYIKKHQHYITKDSAGVQREIMQYKWDEKDGMALDKPVKFMDDIMDAMRYGHYTGRKGVNGLVVSKTSQLTWEDLLKQ